ncbi:PLC-like phosphodiesterase, TIM beta/alpha-barrel domain [Pseudocohnilembus persalinus]|uniref:PLC-like phosphodiesterase, TIM beta/alpha-barrel domain n=1 Tax=Pseudocohnilembus persalinus TaxID=266149 RepID=A0A0V0QRE1_PSEPJ|nr:PLC-like phosphodiesterase, TIM beta/alpha-barrel domain [Pseudocohnilembus persalinus]|eukprot:KRX04827.1 PLC-like phosphodiesterase, TIM beta/alpha-barrel domain [Pseudocohnilembus persalinus]
MDIQKKNIQYDIEKLNDPLNPNNQFLSNWMEHLYPVIKDKSILDLTLPVYTIGEFAKSLSQTQKLNIIEQLDSGIRFIDMRAVYSEIKVNYSKYNWFGLHFLQTKSSLIDLCRPIKDWMKQHSKEILVVQITYHGDTCALDNESAYPGANKKAKQKFWQQFQDLFEEYLYKNESLLNMTSIKYLVETNQRMIVVTSNWEEFTNKSPYAINGCNFIDGIANSSIYTVEESYNFETNFFKNGTQYMQNAKQKNQFVVKNMINVEKVWSILYTTNDKIAIPIQDQQNAVFPIVSYIINQNLNYYCHNLSNNIYSDIEQDLDQIELNKQCKKNYEYANYFISKYPLYFYDNDYTGRNKNWPFNINNPFYSDWMSIMLPLIGDLNFFDLSVPGSHDSLTYDLSEIFADRANSIPLKLSFIMHRYLSKHFGAYGKTQAKCQTLTIKEQLDNGIRWLDLRAVLSQDTPTSLTQNWYGLHFMQTQTKLLDLSQQIRDWMDQHKEEIVVLQLTYHGEECYSETDYPGITTEQKRKFWKNFLEIFKDIAYNQDQYPQLNQMSINDMLDNNIRTVIYVSDYEEFTDSSPYAMNGCTVKQYGGSDIYEQQFAYQNEIEFFQNCSQIKAENKAQNLYTSKSMATSEDMNTILYSLLVNFLPDQQYQDTILKEQEKCSSSFQIPDNKFCPMTLLDVGNWANYYKQLTLDIALNNKYTFPNNIFFDQIYYEGTIKTGIITGELESNKQNQENSRYSLSAVVIKSNWNYVCNKDSLPGKLRTNCDIILPLLQTRIKKYSVYTFENINYGRLENWPQQN